MQNVKDPCLYNRAYRDKSDSVIHLSSYIGLSQGLLMQNNANGEILNQNVCIILSHKRMKSNDN
jgi:hypothetical protein